MYGKKKAIGDFLLGKFNKYVFPVNSRVFKTASVLNDQSAPVNRWHFLIMNGTRTLYTRIRVCVRACVYMPLYGSAELALLRLSDLYSRAARSVRELFESQACGTRAGYRCTFDRLEIIPL